jgi:hypothetical protein
MQSSYEKKLTLTTINYCNKTTDSQKQKHHDAFVCCNLKKM